MDVDVVLAGDRLEPTTRRLGFLNAPVGLVSSWLREWREGLYGGVEVTELAGGFLENFEALEPLTLGAAPRELLVQTADPQWTALFNCGANLSDPQGALSVLAQDHDVVGVMVVSVRDRRASQGRQDQYGARRFNLFGSKEGVTRDSNRHVRVSRDGGSRWSFDEWGPVQDFEDVSFYRRRIVRQRVPVELLVRYAASSGLRPFDEDFYSGPSVLVHSPTDHHAADPPMTLSQARARLELDRW